MVDGGVGTSFPVIFFDGDQEFNIGFIQVHPMLDYKTFQLMLSQRIQISPNQISMYIVDHKDSNSSRAPEDRRKIPITGKTNFASICRLRNCCILVVSKRSRKARSRKPRLNSGDYSLDNVFPQFPQPENVTLLRRNQLPDLSMTSPRYLSSFYDRVPPAELASLNDRMLNLMIQRENYATAMAKPSPDHQNIFPLIEDIYGSMTMTKKETVFFCNECENSQKYGNTASFHHCLNDEVVVGFRSRFGPVGSPFR